MARLWPFPSSVSAPELPKERYAWSWSGVINPVKGPVDEVFRSFLDNLTTESSRRQAQVSKSVTYEFSDTLTEFASRAAVFALREEDCRWLSVGMTAIGLSKSDIRDMDGALKLLIHSAVRSRVDIDPMLRKAAKLSERESRKYILAHVGKGHTFQEPEAIFRREVRTPGGIGFAKLGRERYAPDHDLASMIVELSETVTRDRYHLRSVEIASKVPVDQECSGGVSIESVLIKAEDPREQWRHGLEIHLAEVVNQGSAQKLKAAVERMRPSPHLLLTARAVENLFCLVAAKCHVKHLKVIETPETLARFADAASNLFGRSLGQTDAG